MTHYISTVQAWGFVIHTLSFAKILVGLLCLTTSTVFWSRLMVTGCQDSGQPASWCLANIEILEKVLKQLAHWYFFTSEWVWR